MKKNALLVATSGLLMSTCIISFYRSTPISTANKSFDGATLFSGILFGRGQVAKLLPETQEIFGNIKVNKYDKDKTNSLQNAILKELQTSDPLFLEKFKKEIESGDRLQIQDAITEASKKVEFISLHSEAIQLLKRNKSFINTTTQDVVTEGPIIFDPTHPGTYTDQCSGRLAKTNFKIEPLLEESRVNSIAKILNS